MTATPLPAGSLRATSLNSRRRDDELSGVANGAVVDVLVVGGGVTGTGVALDAASRGLSVALLESHDLAWGTSRWSSKVLHGGLTHLARGEPGLARESAAERGVLMTRTAPHLVRTLPQLLPLHGDVSRRAELALSTGLRTADALRRSTGTPSAVMPPPHPVPTAEARALVPGLNPDGLRGGLLGFEGQLVDDARLVVALARTAAGFGARILPRVRARAIDDRGAEAVDERSGERFRVRARSVVNATGVWAGALAPEVGIGAARGSHLVLDADAVGVSDTAVLCRPREKRGHFVFCLPRPENSDRLRTVLLGPVETPLDGPIPSAPEVPPSDVDRLLDAGGRALGTTLRPEHVVSSFAGLDAVVRDRRHRPTDQVARLLDRSAPRSQSARVLHLSDGGVVTVLAGQLSTYRRIAAEAVDAVVHSRGLAAGPSRTAAVPLVGAADRAELATVDADARLVARYGTEAGRVAALAEFDADLAERVIPDSPLTAAEVLWAVRHEGALEVEDVLDRRTRLGLVPADREQAHASVSDLVARALNGVHT